MARDTDADDARTQEDAEEMLNEIEKRTRTNAVLAADQTSSDPAERTRVLANRETPTEQTRAGETLVAVTVPVDDEGGYSVQRLIGDGDRDWSIADEHVVGTVEEATVAVKLVIEGMQETAMALSESPVLGERQAAVYALRELAGVSRSATADAMSISQNTVDNALAAARANIQSAEEALAQLDDGSDPSED